MCWEDIITITYGCGHVIVESPKRHYCDNPKCKYSASHPRGHDCTTHGCTENIYENRRGWPETHQCYECKEARLAAAGLTLNRPHTGPHGHNMAPGTSGTNDLSQP